MKKELSACIIEKFNGYELLRNQLQFKERKNFIPIDVVYEPTLNDKKTIECFYVPEISLGYYVTRDKLRKGKKETEDNKARQCHYCNNFFVKSAEKMGKKLSCCAGKAGFTYSFDNGKIIDYQDHYKNLGDLPFSIFTTILKQLQEAWFFSMEKCMWSAILQFSPFIQNLKFLDLLFLEVKTKIYMH